MKIAVITDETHKKELLAQSKTTDASILWMSEPESVIGMDCYIDLLFTPITERINYLKKLQPALIIVNSVVTSLQHLPDDFVRINGWPTFLMSNITEGSIINNVLKPTVESALACFGKKMKWVPDIPGFISARVVSMIINEAYFAYEENVSSKEEIDIAMKLGTNYPYGPFEWSNKIGKQNIYALLNALAKNDARYEPAILLKKEVS